MKKIYSLIKNIFFKIWFKLNASEYMRVAYLNPRSVVLITTSYNGKKNIMPIDWHMPLSFSPKLYAISLEKKNYTIELINKSGCFCVNFMSAEFEKEILECGRTSGVNADKFELTNFKTEIGKSINVPVLVNALGILECNVINTVDAGDHVLFIAKVIHEKLHPDQSKKQLYHTTSSAKK